ncbi:MAG TPA: hypothetical protein VHO50_14410 [Bacteroidales bacterium]|nr:hypothetical protein [Bacteroidales bacterium]
MKKIYAISLSLLMLFTGVTVNLAFHYCGGYLAHKEINFSGEAQSCGMEHQGDEPGITNLCCQDKVQSYTFNSNYIPSFIDFETGLTDIPVAEVFSIFNNFEEAATFNFQTGNPPGYFPDNTDLQDICILRI